MQANRWEKIEQIFNKAILLPVEARRNFIEQQCGDDIKLCREILLLVNNDIQENSFLQHPIFTLGVKILDNDIIGILKKSDFASFKVQKILGRGGMGAVFLAEDMRLERLVALKLLPSPFSEEDEAVLRFQQEAKSISGISHQNIVHIYEFGQHEGYYYLAMEYVHGRTLREFIQEKLVNEELAIEIALQISEALSAAHRSGIIHRDIKPENIIITDNGLVKVLDFGIAKLTIASSEIENSTNKFNSLETMPGLIIGTTAYMSPEQIRGQSLDQRTDLWSFGIIFYEMLTGVRPFVGETSSDVQAAILRDSVTLLPKNQICRKELNIIIKKYLEKDRIKRYQTAFDITRDLEKVLTSIKVKNKTISFGKHSLISQRTLQIGLTIIGIVLLALGGIFLFDYIRNFSYMKSIYVNSQSSLAQKKINSLVVLPFSVKNKGKNLYLLNEFSQNLVEELISGIGKANICRVKSLNSASQMENVQDINFIKNKLNVDTIIRGVVTDNHDGSFSVEVELIDANDEIIVWTVSSDNQYTNLLKTQTDILSSVSKNLQPFLKTEKQIFPFMPFESPSLGDDDFSLYLQSKGSFVDDIKFLEKIVGIDTEKEARILAPDSLQYLQESQRVNYTRAYLALAKKFYSRQSTDVPDKVFKEKAKIYTDRALLFDKEFSEALTLRAQIKMNEYDWTGAEKDFNLAIDSNPNNATARYYLGRILLPTRGKFNESLEELKTAYDISPLSEASLLNMSEIKMFMNDYEGAIIDCERLIELYPDSVRAYSCKSIALMKLGHFDKAIEAANKVIEFTASKSDTAVGIFLQIEGKSKLGVIYAANGQIAEAQAIINEIEQKQIEEQGLGYQPAYNYEIASIYAAMGNKERAFEFLEKDLELNSGKLIFIEYNPLLDIEYDPLLDPLRDDLRFNKFKHKVKSTLFQNQF